MELREKTKKLYDFCYKLHAGIENISLDLNRNLFTTDMNNK